MNKQFELNEPFLHPFDDEDVPANPATLPKIYRLVTLTYKEMGTGEFQYVATIFHEMAPMRVTWVANRLSTNLTVGNLVSIRWTGKTSVESDAIRIARLVHMECPEHWVNLFDTVPYEWVKDRGFIKNAAKLVKLLPSSSRYLFNCNYWEKDRFMGLCRSKNLGSLIDSTNF